MASFVAYFMSVSCLVLGLFVLFVVFGENKRLTRNGARLGILMFLLLGFMAWGFAYLGGI